MLQIQRLTLVWITVIFFLCTAPWLAFYAIGYDIDLLNTDLINSMTIDVETGPDRAEVKVRGDFGKKTEYSNTSFRIPAGQFARVDFIRTGYLTDTFYLYGQKEENSLARLQKVNLLPSEPTNLGQLNNKWENLDFVSRDLFIFQNTEKDARNRWQIQQYGINGLYGDPQTISFKSDLITESYLVNGNPQFRTNQSGKWEKINDQTYWNQLMQALLYRHNSSWVVWDAASAGLGKVKVVEMDDDHVLIQLTDLDNSLYLFNLNSNQLRFLGNNVLDISSTSDSVWYVSDKNVYRITKNLDNFQNSINFQNEFILDTFPNIKSITAENVELKSYNIYQGVVLKINGQLYYKPDNVPDRWRLIANNVRLFKYNRNSLFWFDNEGSFRNLNMELNEQVLIGKPAFKLDPTRIVDFVYYPDWHRYVFYYLPENSDKLSVSSVWFNPDLVQNTISSYSWQNWLGEMRDCDLQIQSSFQVCLNQNNNFVTYRNQY
ncbi:MAG: hypothetical protein OHK0017_04160 [Patescibacteria group bacterium]